MGVPGIVVRAPANSGTRRLWKETHGLYWFRPSTWSSNNLTSSSALACLRRIALSIGYVQLFTRDILTSPYSPGAERSCLCSTRIQGQSPKLCFGRLSLYNPNWSFGLARCFAPCSSWRLGYGPCYQCPLPYNTVFGGPVGFPIDKPPSISWLSFKGLVVVVLIWVLLEVKSWDGLLWFFFWLMCTFAWCPPGSFSFECNFAKIALIECSPRAFCFLVQKARGSKNLKICFSVVGTCSPGAFFRVLFCWKEAGRRFLICTPLIFVFCWSRMGLV